MNTNWCRILKVAVISVVAITLMAGCVGTPSPASETSSTPSPSSINWPAQGKRPDGILGLPTPVTLTAEDKSLLTLIAQGPVYQLLGSKFEWLAIIWDENAVPATVWTLDEDAALKGVPEYINPNALWYPAATVTLIGTSVVYQKQVAVDYDSFRVVYTAVLSTQNIAP
ncbi:hypothetical protein Dform_02060 [Dehalogenimonas formicexedens]|uniref:Uncharacterized protein n=1 Tax=Dehalogenimonas formicexedens TaxID=1839801 RepID=A0A1P8FA77_9CHLR|nr:hypothetical protein [Dehalogenimonas formicexedens]APV45369.1 hypothetical protein Dform_02060 [Dehalogenimonas formicexedens]